jgi:hypothetical protein
LRESSRSSEREKASLLRGIREAFMEEVAFYLRRGQGWKLGPGISAGVMLAVMTAAG